MSTSVSPFKFTDQTWSPLESLGQQWSRMPVALLAGMLALVGALAFNIANLRSEDATEKVGLDAQVLFKLAMVGVCGLYGLIQVFRDRRLYHVLTTWPNILLALLSGLFLLTSLTALEPLHAMVSAVTIISVMLATIAISLQIGPIAVLQLAWGALSTHVAICWLLFLFVPSIGVFQEPIAHGEYFARMGGLSHPNTLGQYSGLLVVIALCLLRLQHYPQWLRWAIWLSVVMALVALVLSVSRSSAIAMIVTLAAIFRRDWLTGRGLQLTLLLGTLAVGCLFVLLLTTDLADSVSTRLAESFSKSGDAEELTSGTGRNVIWGYSLKLISESPVLGYGLTSSKLLLANYTLYTHNLVLNVALSAGVFAAGFVVLLILNQLIRVLSRPQIAADGILIFIVINGLMENVIFEYIGAGATILFALSVTWRACDSARISQQLEP
jgi:O-antigen ligase